MKTNTDTLKYDQQTGDKLDDNEIKSTPGEHRPGAQSSTRSVTSVGLSSTYLNREY